MVSTGQEFTVELTVPTAGKQFNAFDFNLYFPPQLVSFVPGSQQVGPDVTMVCSSLFHRFTPYSGRLEVHLSLLCANTFLTGPATVYRVKFKALNIAGGTGMFFTAQFFRAGIAQEYGTHEGLTLCVQDCITRVAEEPLAIGLSMSTPMPNPRSGAGPVRFDFVLPREDRVAIEIVDLQGRAVTRSNGEAFFGAGKQSLSWQVPRLGAGVYLARMRTRTGLALARRWVIVE